MPITLNNFPEFRPYSNVQPFTVRDGATFLLQLEALKDWIRDYVVPQINSEIGGLTENWEAQTLALIENFERVTLEYIQQVQELADGVSEDKDAAEQARLAAEAARDLAEQFASDAEEIQDSAIATIFNNSASAFRLAADAVYADASTVDGIAGELATVVSALSGLASKASVMAVEDRVETLETYTPLALAGKADKSVQTTVETGRLSEESIEAIVTEAGSQAHVIDRGGMYALDPRLERMRDGILNRDSMNTRVVVLGSSTAVGGYTTKPEQGVFQRMAFRSGATVYRNLEDASSPVPSGMQWYSGALGGVQSGNYLGSARVGAIAIVNPTYTIHMVGSNDYASGISINTYKANMEAAISAIDAVAPNTIHVLIHGNGRRDITPPIAWENYGAALAEVAGVNPAKRVFIDVSDAFNILALNKDNFAGIVLPDNIHMGNEGHKFMADYLSALMGIPIESKYASIPDIRKYPFPSSAAYSADTAIAGISIPAANYPRFGRLAGSVFTTPAHANGEIMARVMDGATNISNVTFRMGRTTAGSMPISGMLYIPPAKAVTLDWMVFPISTMQISGNSSYTEAYVELISA